jgi:hypothetical protein
VKKLFEDGLSLENVEVKLFWQQKYLDQVVGILMIILEIEKQDLIKKILERL